MNAKSIADQLSLVSTIIHQSKDCPEASQQLDEWGTSADMIIQAAAMLEKIPHILDREAGVALSTMADCR